MGDGDSGQVGEDLGEVPLQPVLVRYGGAEAGGGQARGAPPVRPVLHEKAVGVIAEAAAAEQ